MERILNLLLLKPEQREAFLRAAPGMEQVFAPDGRREGSGAPLTPEDFRGAAVILGNPPPAFLKECRNLRLLQTRSAGTEQYQAPGVLPAGTLLRSASGAYGHSVAEHMFAMLLSLLKRLPAYRDQQREGLWQDLGPAKSLSGAEVLCVGTGDLGSSFARLCQALGAHTLGVRRDPSRLAQGVEEMHGTEELDALLPRADVVALMLPQSTETFRLMDRARLALLKPDCILLNGGRGNAVDCLALAEALEEGRLWGAGLDVTDPEPLPPSHPLWRQARAILTPHAAGGYHLPDTADRIAAIALRNLKAFLEA